MKVPCSYAEVEEITSYIYSQNHHVISIVSPKIDHGNSVLANSIATKLSVDGNDTLLLDFDTINASLSKFYQYDDKIMEKRSSEINNRIIAVDSHLYFAAATVNQQLDERLKNINVLSDLFKNITEKYQYIIIDCLAFKQNNKNNLPISAMCMHSDAYILNIMSGKVSSNDIADILDSLSKTTATLMGTVLNDRDFPSLNQELIRETHRFDKILPKLMSRIRNTIQHSDFLNLEI